MPTQTFDFDLTAAGAVTLTLDPATGRAVVTTDGVGVTIDDWTDLEATVRLGIGLHIAATRAGGPPAPDLLTGLVSYYRFQDSLTDSSGHGRDLTVASGTAQYGNGLIDRGLVKTVGGAVYTGPAGPIAGQTMATGAYSISWWVKVFAESGSGASVFIDDADGFASPAVATSGLVPRLDVLYGEETQDTADLSVGWRHLVTTFGGGVAKTYVDGVLTITRDVAAFTVPCGASVRLTIGATCVVDELALHAVTLTPAQVAALYNGGAGFDPTA